MYLQAAATKWKNENWQNRRTAVFPSVPPLFLWKHREKAGGKGQQQTIQGLRSALGRHYFFWFTFYRCSSPCTSSKGNDALL